MDKFNLDIQGIKNLFRSRFSSDNIWVKLVGNVINLLVSIVVFIISMLSLYYFLYISERVSFHDLIIDSLMIFIVLRFNFTIPQYIMLDFYKSIDLVSEIIDKYEDF